MKTLEQIIDSYKFQAMDGRDVVRLMQFVPEDKLSQIGITPTHRVHPRGCPGTAEKDVEFGFEKALDQRGLSAGMMFTVVSMWNWILEEGLEDHDTDTGYAQHGLPLFKATAVKYGFDNPIGDDAGNEAKYAS